MQKRITRIAPVQAGKMAAALYFCFSVPILAIMAVAAAIGSASGKPAPPMIFIVVLPVAYTVMGFVFTSLAALLYNFIAGYVGGVEFTTVEAPEA